KFGFNFWRIAAGDPCFNLAVDGHHFMPVFVNIPDQGLNFRHRQPQGGGDVWGRSACLQIIDHVVNRNSCPAKFGPAPPVNDLKVVHESSSSTSNHLPAFYQVVSE